MQFCWIKKIDPLCNLQNLFWHTYKQHWYLTPTYTEVWKIRFRNIPSVVFRSVFPKLLDFGPLCWAILCFVEVLEKFGSSIWHFLQYWLIWYFQIIKGLSIYRRVYHPLCLPLFWKEICWLGFLKVYEDMLGLRWASLFCHEPQHFG